MSLSGETPVVKAVTHTLSEKTKVVGHPGDKWKSGYVTFSRVAQNRHGWRNVHISKRSFEKLCENLNAFSEALANKTHNHLMLTKKQHVLTTSFKPEGKDALMYVSILHPVDEAEIITPKDAMNHSKTINITIEEFEKFVSLHREIMDVVQSKTSTPESEDSLTLDCFRWTCKDTGDRSPWVFTTREECSRNADFHYCQLNREHFQGQPMEYDYESHYEFHPVVVRRPNKLEVIQHVAYCMAVKDLARDGVDMTKPPPEVAVVEVLFHLDRPTLKVMARKVLTKLSYKNLYLTGELVDIFDYTGGLEKVHHWLVKHIQSCDGKFYTRLIDHCYDAVLSDMGKE